MVEHCDKCGTELDPSQARHHGFRIEHVANDVDALEGCLCADCFVGLEEWLAAS